MGENKGFGFGNVGRVVDVDDAGKRVCIDAQAGGQERTLEVAHTRHARFDAVFQDRNHRLCKRVDAAGDIAALSRGLIAECAYVQGVVGLYVKGLFVVDKIGHGHIGVGCVGLLKSLDIVGKLLFVKQGVDRREAEPFGRDARRQLIKTVHRTRRIFDDEAYGIALLQLFDMALYLREPVMGDDVYAGGIVLHEDAAKPVYERFSVHRNERFGLRDTLPGKPGTFAGGDNGIFHGYIRLEVDLV